MIDAASARMAQNIVALAESMRATDAPEAVPG